MVFVLEVMKWHNQQAVGYFMRGIFLCFYVLLQSSFFLCAEEIPYQPEFTVVIPSYNNGRNHEYMCIKNLESVFAQTYPKFSVVYIDDCSTDDTGAIVDSFVREHHLENKIKVIHNTERKGALRNLYEVIHALDPHTIVVQVDGDDMLANSKVLEYQAKVFSDQSVWISIGSYKTFPGNEVKLVAPVPKKVLKSGDFRSYHFCWYPLRTFYAKLFQLIDKEDLLYKEQFYPVCWDEAMMRPMLSMASPSHVGWSREVLYLYYLNNPISDFKINKTLMKECGGEILSKPPYKSVVSLF